MKALREQLESHHIEAKAERAEARAKHYDDYEVGFWSGYEKAMRDALELLSREAASR